MPWHPPRQPMVWEWFGVVCDRHDVAEHCTSQAALGRKVTEFIPFPDNNVLVLSIQGTVAPPPPPPPVKKAKRPKKTKAVEAPTEPAA